MREKRDIARGRWQPLDEIADFGYTRFVVVQRVVRDTADLCVRRGAAERLRIDHLAGRALHQVRATEAHE